MRYGYDMDSYLIFAHKDLTEAYFVEKSGCWRVCQRTIPADL